MTERFGLKKIIPETEETDMKMGSKWKCLNKIKNFFTGKITVKVESDRVKSSKPSFFKKMVTRLTKERTKQIRTEEDNNINWIIEKNNLKKDEKSEREKQDYEDGREVCKGLNLKNDEEIIGELKDCKEEGEIEEEGEYDEDAGMFFEDCKEGEIEEEGEYNEDAGIFFETIGEVFEDAMLTNNKVSCNQNLLGETLSAGLLDSGCSKTVCSKTWLDIFKQSLSKEMKEITEKMTPSKCTFKFGNDIVVKSMGRVTLPIFLKKWIYIEVEVVENSQIPLLISRELMKKTGTKISFEDNKVEMLGMNQNVVVTKNGHICVPLLKTYIEENSGKSYYPVYFMDKIEGTDEKTKKRIALKLHEQFAHPRSMRLLKLLKDGGVNDKELNKMIEEVEKTCTVCQKYKRPLPRPAVCFPRARQPNINVSLDLKQFGKRYLIHFIDHYTRFSSGSVIEDKKPESVMKALNYDWLRFFGPPRSILSDNGREFNNDGLRKMCEQFNIEVTTSAAESPWSNGVVERHNDTVGIMIEKLMGEGHKLEVAVPWVMYAKNCLSNSEGFSPCQLTFGYNPTIPSVLNSTLPALGPREGLFSEELQNILALMRDVRMSYVHAESSQKLRRAILKKTRSHNPAISYVIGDKVYYMRLKDKWWRGPGLVTSVEEKNIGVKHGGELYKVHPCRVKHVYSKEIEDEEGENCEVDKEVSSVPDSRNPVEDVRTSSREVSSVADSRNPVEDVRTDRRASDSNQLRNDDEFVDVNVQSGDRESSIDEVDQVRDQERNQGSSTGGARDNNMYPLPKSYVEVKVKESDIWLRYRVISKGWKNNCKRNEFWYNVIQDGEEKMKSIYWKDVDLWREIPEDVLISSVAEDIEAMEAKLVELQK